MVRLILHRRSAAIGEIPRPLPWALLALLAAATPGRALLLPEQVLVVANANAKGSQPLGKYYCLARGVLPDRLILLRTTTGPDVDREEYNADIRDPIRSYLKRNDPKGTIKCIVLVWGMPVRVLGTKMTPAQKARVAAYKTASQRLGARLAVNLKLLPRVAVSFPPPRTSTLKPLGELFEADAVANPEGPATFQSLAASFAKELKYKYQRAGKLADPRQRRTALRQLAGLRLDTYGARALLKNPPAERIPGVPDKGWLRKRIESAEFDLARLRAGRQTPETARRAVELALRVRGVIGAHRYCQERISAVATAEEDASVDSELALLWEDGAGLRKWRPNPMNWRVAASRTRPENLPKRIIMTARIDGPVARNALRIIKDSIAAEKTRLKGTFYIDAGGKYPPYDRHLEKLADLVKKRTAIPVKYDKEKALFGRGQCPDALLYVGWYSLGNYVPAFTWVRGAVGWHVASLEAQHLRAPASNEWCVKLIQNGIAATLGAVNEPFLGAFPPPEEFFALLLTGRFTVAECYWRTVPAVSWRLTLIADPLYNPFKLYPRLSVFDLPPELGGWKRTSPRKPPAPAPQLGTRPAQ